MTWVTELSHFIDAIGSLPATVPGPARRCTSSHFGDFIVPLWDGDLSEL